MVRFSRTLRANLRDPSIYSTEKIWTTETATIAENLLSFVNHHCHLPGNDVVPSYLHAHDASGAGAGAAAVWPPHASEVVWPLRAS